MHTVVYKSVMTVLLLQSFVLSLLSKKAVTGDNTDRVRHTQAFGDHSSLLDQLLNNTFQFRTALE